MERVTYHFHGLSKLLIPLIFNLTREDWYNGYETESCEGGVYFYFFKHKILFATYFKEIYD